MEMTFKQITDLIQGKPSLKKHSTTIPQKNSLG